MEKMAELLTALFRGNFEVRKTRIERKANYDGNCFQEKNTILSLVVIYHVWPAQQHFPRAQKIKKGGAEKHPPFLGPFGVSCPFLSF
jgi:hypothetical protein